MKTRVCMAGLLVTIVAMAVLLAGSPNAAAKAQQPVAATKHKIENGYQLLHNRS